MRVGEFVARAGGLGEALLQRGDLALEPGDLGVARVGALAGVLEVLKSPSEFNALSHTGTFWQAIALVNFFVLVILGQRIVSFGGNDTPPGLALRGMSQS